MIWKVDFIDNEQQKITQNLHKRWQRKNDDDDNEQQKITQNLLMMMMMMMMMLMMMMMTMMMISQILLHRFHIHNIVIARPDMYKTEQRTCIFAIVMRIMFTN